MVQMWAQGHAKQEGSGNKADNPLNCEKENQVIDLVKASACRGISESSVDSKWKFPQRKLTPFGNMGSCFDLGWHHCSDSHPGERLQKVFLVAVS